MGKGESRSGKGIEEAAQRKVAGAETVSPPVELSRVQIEPGIFDLKMSNGETWRAINLTAAVVWRPEYEFRPTQRRDSKPHR
jgi:hypothetical protein